VLITLQDFGADHSAAEGRRELWAGPPELGDLYICIFFFLSKRNVFLGIINYFKFIEIMSGF